MNNIYTISQVLGSHYNTESNKLSDLHNLFYTSTDAYTAGLERYRKEECQFPISKQEFMNYLRSHIEGEVAVIITHYNNEVLNMNFSFIGKIENDIIESDTKNHDELYYLDKYVGTTDMYFIAPAVSVGDKHIYKIDEIFENIFNKMIYGFRNGIRTSLDPFACSECDVTFDVLTMYEILTNRGSCIRLINDYAKKIVLTTFNKYTNILSNNNSILMLNFYLYSNAQILGIADNYKLLEDIPDDMDFDTYFIETQEPRKNLIKNIEEIINNM